MPVDSSCRILFWTAKSCALVLLSAATATPETLAASAAVITMRLIIDNLLLMTTPSAKWKMEVQQARKFENWTRAPVIIGRPPHFHAISRPSHTVAAVMG
jgi:hypothetical protein